MQNIEIDPSAEKVLHNLTLQDLRTCELALSMLLKKRELFGAEVISRLSDTLNRLSDARCICQVEAGRLKVAGEKALHFVQKKEAGDSHG